MPRGAMQPAATAAVILGAWVLASCAGPAQLARQSRRHLAAGEFRQAYETARRGVDRDPRSAVARRAMTEAARARMEDWRRRVIVIAEADTVAAARFALERSAFGAELVRYRIEVPGDSAYAVSELRIRRGAAAIEYRRAEGALSGRRPKEATARFETAAEYDPGYRDVLQRAAAARRLATARVAVLPFADETGVPGLPQALADEVHRRLADALRQQGGFRYTELVERDEVNATLTLRSLAALGTDEALRIARGVEADRVVVGRVRELRTGSSSVHFDRPVYRRSMQRDSSGHERVRWVESRLTAVSRERVVRLRCDVEVLDARSRRPLAAWSEPLEAVARVVWTDFRPQGAEDDYVLTPPDLAGSDPAGERAARQAWRECFGDWKLPELLRRTREVRRHGVYRRVDVEEFRSDSRQRPVPGEELPGENDLVALAAREVWRPIVAALRDLDRKD